MNILITGDDGFMGGNLKALVLSKGISVAGFSRKKGRDVLNKDQVRAAVKEAELVFHLGAEAKPAESVLEPVETIETNLKGALNVLEACREYGVPLIYPSSCEIYGDSKTPITEDFPLNPPNPYSAAKAAIDRICYTYFKSYNLDVKIPRFFNPYGPYQQLNKIIPTFYFKALRNEPITVYGDGNDTRDYTYISDIAECLWRCRELSPGDVINVATGVATTNLQVANLIKNAIGSKSTVVLMDYPKIFGGIKYQIGSNEKANLLLNWKPKVSFNEGLKQTLKWLSSLGR